MAEIVYKDIPGMDPATLPLAGTEYIEISQAGATKKGLWSGIFGAGWWTALKAALTAFVAPEATHAVDSDTLEGESASDFHDAAQLTGVIHLDRIPAQLTGKNAATATLAANSTLADYADASGISASIGYEAVFVLPTAGASYAGSVKVKISDASVWMCITTDTTFPYTGWVWIQLG